MANLRWLASQAPCKATGVDHEFFTSPYEERISKWLAETSDDRHTLLDPSPRRGRSVFPPLSVDDNLRTAILDSLRASSVVVCRFYRYRSGHMPCRVDNIQNVEKQEFTGCLFRAQHPRVGTLAVK